jgi:hypothetical protein
MRASRLFEATLVNEPTALPTTEANGLLEESGDHQDTRLREDWSSVNGHFVHSWDSRDPLINQDGRELDGAFRRLDESLNASVNRTTR